MLPQDTGSSPPLTSRSQPGSLQVAAILGTSKQLEVDSAGQRVRRTSPLDPETAMAEVDARSIYAKPFPFDVTLDGLMQFWNTVAPTRGVRLRRHAVSLDFKGSIFVEFDCCATADQVGGQLRAGLLLPDSRACEVARPHVRRLRRGWQLSPLGVAPCLHAAQPAAARSGAGGAV